MLNVINEYYKDLDTMQTNCIIIPRGYAREENDKELTLEEAKEADHYELYITRQVGSIQSRRKAYIYVKLPSGRFINISIYPDGRGIEFEPSMRKYVLREYDDLDRRILLGYCKMYDVMLHNACYSNDPDINWLQYHALHYRASKQPKRIKTGPIGTDMTYVYKSMNLLDKYDESSIFSKVQLI